MILGDVTDVAFIFTYGLLRQAGGACPGLDPGPSCVGLRFVGSVTEPVLNAIPHSFLRR
jgi:hypothetical protein